MTKTHNKLLLVLLAGFAFGSSIVMARFALREIDPLPLVALRFAIASIAYIIVLALWKKTVTKNRRRLIDMMLVGFFGTGLALLIFHFALLYVSSAMLAIFLAILPLCTAAMAHFFLNDEKLNKQLMSGLAISLGGVVYLIASKTNGLVESFVIAGPILALSGVFFAAAGGVYARKYLSGEDPFVVSSIQSIAAFSLIFTVVLLLGKFQFNDVSISAWLAAVYNGIVGSFFAFWATFELIKRYGATASALSGYVMPVVSSILGVVLLGEILSLSLIIGSLIVLAGLTLVIKQQSKSPNNVLE
jgi:drug/metabolite transporter (DMT)-like permease